MFRRSKKLLAVCNFTPAIAYKGVISLSQQHHAVSEEARSIKQHEQQQQTEGSRWQAAGELCCCQQQRCQLPLFVGIVLLLFTDRLQSHSSQRGKKHTSASNGCMRSRLRWDQSIWHYMNSATAVAGHKESEKVFLASSNISTRSDVMIPGCASTIAFQSASLCLVAATAPGSMAAVRANDPFHKHLCSALSVPQWILCSRHGWWKEHGEWVDE